MAASSRDVRYGQDWTGSISSAGLWKKVLGTLMWMDFFTFFYPQLLSAGARPIPRQGHFQIKCQRRVLHWGGSGRPFKRLKHAILWIGEELDWDSCWARALGEKVGFSNLALIFKLVRNEKERDFKTSFQGRAATKGLVSSTLSWSPQPSTFCSLLSDGEYFKHNSLKLTKGWCHWKMKEF